MDNVAPSVGYDRCAQQVSGTSHHPACWGIGSRCYKDDDGSKMHPAVINYNDKTLTAVNHEEDFILGTTLNQELRDLDRLNQTTLYRLVTLDLNHAKRESLLQAKQRLAAATVAAMKSFSAYFGRQDDESVQTNDK